MPKGYEKPPKNQEVSMPLVEAEHALEAIRDAHTCLLGMPPSDRVIKAMECLKVAALAVHNAMVLRLRGAA